MKKFQLIIFLVFTSLFAKGENLFQYASLLIPDSLKKNAYAVIRDSEFVIDVASNSKVTIRENYAITILNEGGEVYGLIYEFYDNSKKINNIKLTYLNTLGQEIEKVKLNKFSDVSAANSFSLYEDNRVKYYEPQIKTYPYTVLVEAEYEYKGTLHIPDWIPQLSSHVAVQKANFILRYPESTQIKYKVQNIVEPEISQENGIHQLKWQVNNLLAYKQIPYAQSHGEITPRVYISATNFYFEDTYGNMSSWEQFGKWIFGLTQSQSDLPVETKNEIAELTKDLESDVEKIEAIYKYMQNKTRYVSIQLGIGGYQPFSASLVDEVGYGDCKALSNYTKCLLDAVDIKSYYTIIKAGDDRNIQSDFPSQQFNHVILTVPVENDTIWLECTSQDNPFGYLGDFTDNRYALMVDENGGKLIRTKKYHKHENTEYNTVNAVLNHDGTIKVHSNRVFGGKSYEYRDHLTRKSAEEQEKWLYENYTEGNIKINSFSISAVDSILPQLTEIIDFTSTKYAQMAGSRLIFTPNIVNNYTFVPDEVENRQLPVIRESAYVENDSIQIRIPENYSAEYIPMKQMIENEFGSYSIETVAENNQIIVHRHLEFNEGTFPPESYEKLVEFYKDIVKADNAKVILKKSL